LPEIGRKSCSNCCLKGRPVRNEMRGSNEDYKLIEIMEDAQDVRVLDGNGIAAYLIG